MIPKKRLLEYSFIELSQGKSAVSPDLSNINNVLTNKEKKELNEFIESKENARVLMEVVKDKRFIKKLHKEYKQIKTRDAAKKFVKEYLNSFTKPFTDRILSKKKKSKFYKILEYILRILYIVILIGLSIAVFGISLGASAAVGILTQIIIAFRSYFIAKLILHVLKILWNFSKETIKTVKRKLGI